MTAAVSSHREEVGADHNLREGSVPTPTACVTCSGDGVIGELGSLHPCSECCCVICGEVTDMPPECGRCEIEEDRRQERRADV